MTDSLVHFIKNILSEKVVALTANSLERVSLSYVKILHQGFSKTLIIDKNVLL